MVMTPAILRASIDKTKAELAEAKQPDDFTARLRSCDDVALLRGMVEDLLDLPEAAHAEGWADGAFDDPLKQGWLKSTSLKRLDQIKSRVT